MERLKRFRSKTPKQQTAPNHAPSVRSRSASTGSSRTTSTTRSGPTPLPERGRRGSFTIHAVGAEWRSYDVPTAPQPRGRPPEPIDKEFALFNFCGRRYIRDTRYILPADLRELQRQNLTSTLMSHVLGAPISSPIDRASPPRAILEVGCGGAYWTSLCHDYLRHMGLPPVKFTGFDVLARAPNLRGLGVDWTFVLHDMRRTPWPFPAASFDVIALPQVVLAFPNGLVFWKTLLAELLRLLRPGGTAEFRDINYVTRRLALNPRPVDGVAPPDELVARKLGFYFMDAGTEFEDTANPFLREINAWMAETLYRWQGYSDPIAGLCSIKHISGFEAPCSRRVAVPLAKRLDWEVLCQSGGGAPGDLMRNYVSLAHVDLRVTALQVMVQTVEALEPYLRITCGMNEHEWARWWNIMAANLFDTNGCAGGECLELGAWWITKLPENKEKEAAGA